MIPVKKEERKIWLKESQKSDSRKWKDGPKDPQKNALEFGLPSNARKALPNQDNHKDRILDPKVGVRVGRLW